MEILCPLHPPPPSFLKGHLGFSQTCQNISVTALLPPAPGTASFPLNTYQVIQHMATQIHNGCRLTGEMGWLKQQRNTFFSQVSFNHSQVFSVQHHSYKLVGPSLKNSGAYILWFGKSTWEKPSEMTSFLNIKVTGTLSC